MKEESISAIAGALGGIVALVSTYPLLTISTRQQIRSSTSSVTTTTSSSSSSCSDSTSSSVVVGPSTPRISPQLVTQNEKENEKESWSSLYSGISPAIIGTAATYGSFYYFYNLFHRINSDGGNTSLSTAMSLLTGSEAGAVSAVFTNPIWVVVTVMQASQKSKNIKVENQKADLAITMDENKKSIESSPSFLTITKNIFQKEGISGFFKGIVPALILVANPAIQFMVFEKLKAFVSKRFGENKKPSALIIFILSAFSKLIATFITYPYIVVKSRLQVQKSTTTTNVTKGESTNHYAGTMDVLQKIYNQEGIIGFYKGLNSKLLQSVLNASILFVAQDQIFEMCKSLLSSKPTKKKI